MCGELPLPALWENIPPSLLLGAGVVIGGLRFRISFRGGSGDNVLAAEWCAGDAEKLPLSGLAKSFGDTPMGFDIPGAVADFNLALSKIILAYNFSKNTFQFAIEAARYGKLAISAEAKDPAASGRLMVFLLKLNSKFYFSDLPVLGDGIGKDDCVGLNYFRVSVHTGTGAFELGGEIALVISGKTMIITLPPGASVQPDKCSSAGGLLSREDGSSAVKWLDINKDAGPLHLSRLGFEMGDGRVTLYVDAGVRLSVLLLEFLGLHLSVPLKSGEKVGFGLDGLAVTVSRNPLYISGGLYISDEGGIRLYTGMLSVRISKFQLTALGSYGQMKSDAEGNAGGASLFVFLMLNYPIGGPPVFFVTGIAGGFGYNRTIILPAQVKDVAAFPFVAAAMNRGDLKKDMTPSQVLIKMNQYIKPCDGQYFISLGVKFTSFGFIESFVLVNILFGEHFSVSVLGLSRLDLPTGSADPLIHIELAIKAVIAPGDGVISVEGALTDGCYLLDKNCKLSGGFAFYTWFGDNVHAGDFVITLGGYRTGFLVEHYPAVDRLAVNWKICEEVMLTASFYFALTPSCVMMGGNLSLTYDSGRLKAWFRAWADFYMQWKPFLYYISIGISIGASYNWDFFPFYTTFKVELSAAVDLWGPPFGGTAHVKWWVISFTVRFGSSEPRPDPVGWGEFSKSFLPQPEGDKSGTDKITANDNALELITAKAVDGMVRRGDDTEAGSSDLLDCDHMRVEITTRIPCTSIVVGDRELTSCTKLGILPMGITSFKSLLNITITPPPGGTVPDLLKCETINSKLPRALWDKKKPEPHETETLMDGVPTGITLYCGKRDPEGVLPVSGAYKMKTLCENERLTPHYYGWPVTEKIDPGKIPADPIGAVENSIGRMGGLRQKILSKLSSAFGVRTEEEISVSSWTRGLNEILLSIPQIDNIGSGIYN